MQHIYHRQGSNFPQKKTPNNLTSEVESTSNVTEANENK
jgi:hypothetical protein